MKNILDTWIEEEGEEEKESSNLFQIIENRFLSLEDSSTRRLREFLLLGCIRMTKKRLYSVSADYAGQGHVNVFLETVPTTLVTNASMVEMEKEREKIGRISE